MANTVTIYCKDCGCGNLARGIRIGRRVVKGRFIVLMAAAAALLLWLVLPKGAESEARETVTAAGSMDMEVSGPAFSIWQEEVYTAPQGQRVERYVSDGAKVISGDTIAEIFPAEGDSAVLDQLYALREDIARYQLSILDEGQKEALAALNTQIEETAAAIQTLALDGDPLAVAERESQLKALMSDRQEWLDENVNPDQRLLGLYQQEGVLMQKLAKEMIPIIAPADGYVSFSVDGWENKLSLDLVDYITPADMENWLKDQGHEKAADSAPSGEVPFFKIIYDKPWCLVVQVENAAGLYAGDSVSIRWNDGAEALAAEVTRTTEGQGHDLVFLQPDGPPTHPRYGYVRVLKTAAGIRVPAGALYRENGRDYVLIEYEGKATPIEVHIEALGDEYAIVSATGDVEGLAPGVKVYGGD